MLPIELCEYSPGEFLNIYLFQIGTKDFLTTTKSSNKLRIFFPYRVIVEDPARFPRVPTSKPFSGSGEVADDDDEYYSDEDEEVRPGNVSKTRLEK